MSWGRDHLAPVETLLFRSSLVKIGWFSCAENHPCFAATGPLDNDVFVFARNPLWLRRETPDYRFVEPGAVLIHRAGTEIERRRSQGKGDHTWWFGIHPDVFSELLSQSTLSGREIGQIFSTDPLLRFRLASLVNSLDGDVRDGLLIDEEVLSLFGTICARRSGARPAPCSAKFTTMRRRQQLVDITREYVDAHLAENIGLHDIAVAVGTSTYHLCRTFRQSTGQSLHSYRTQQRLGRAVEHIAADAGRDLTSIALATGFSSHSHLSHIFKQRTGVPPSTLRQSR